MCALTSVSNLAGSGVGWGSKPWGNGGKHMYVHNIIVDVHVYMHV